MGMTASMALVAGGIGMQSQGIREAGKVNRDVARYNAQVSEMQAADALERGYAREMQQRFTTRATIGQQRAALAAQGFDLADDTALQIQQDTAYFGEVDALTLRNNAALEAWGYKVQATDQRMQGELDYAAARNQAAGTLLGGGGQVAMRYASSGGPDQFRAWLGG